MTQSNSKAVALFSAKDLNISFPTPKDFVPAAVALATQNAITNGGFHTPEGNTYVEKSEILQLLGTDKAAVNEFYNDLPEADKLQNGNDRLVNTAALMGEISRRIQEPFPANKAEHLKYAEECVRTFRDHPQLERSRTVLEAQLERDWPAAREQARKDVTHCQVTGEPLEPNAHVHHIERRADKPSLTIDPQNLVVTNPTPHRLIHKAEAHSPEKLEALAKENGWPWRMNSPVQGK